MIIIIIYTPMNTTKAPISAFKERYIEDLKVNINIKYRQRKKGPIN
jgi:hypothetical protein